MPPPTRCMRLSTGADVGTEIGMPQMYSGMYNNSASFGHGGSTASNAPPRGARRRLQLSHGSIACIPQPQNISGFASQDNSRATAAAVAGPPASKPSTCPEYAHMFKRPTKVCIKIATTHDPHELDLDALPRLEKLLQTTAKACGAPVTPYVVQSTVFSGCICIALDTVGVEGTSPQLLLHHLLPNLLVTLGLEGKAGVDTSQALQSGQTITLQIGDQTAVAVWCGEKIGWYLLDSLHGMPVQGVSSGVQGMLQHIQGSTSPPSATLASRPLLGPVLPSLLTLPQTQPTTDMTSEGLPSTFHMRLPPQTMELLVWLRGVDEACMVDGWRPPTDGQHATSTYGRYTLKVTCCGQAVATEVMAAVWDMSNGGLKLQMSICCTDMSKVLAAAKCLHPNSDTHPLVRLVGVHLELWHGDLFIADSPILMTLPGSTKAAAQQERNKMMSQELAYMRNGMLQTYSMFAYELAAWLNMVYSVINQYQGHAAKPPSATNLALDKLILWGNNLFTHACACHAHQLSQGILWHLQQVQLLPSSTASTPILADTDTGDAVMQPILQPADATGTAVGLDSHLELATAADIVSADSTDMADMAVLVCMWSPASKPAALVPAQLRNEWQQPSQSRANQQRSLLLWLLSAFTSWYRSKNLMETFNLHRSSWKILLVMHLLLLACVFTTPGLLTSANVG